MGEMLSNTTNGAPSGPPLMDSQNLPADTEEVLGFSIFQCKSCRSIIGDTSSVLIYNKETSLITLQSKNSFLN